MRLRQTGSRGEWVRLLLVGIGTVAIVLLASRVEEIGERIPFVFLALWVGSATMASLVFVPSAPDPSVPTLTPQAAARRHLWGHKLRLTSISLLPLTLVPLLEVSRSGYDPALWLIDGALVITLCSVPYFTLLAQGLVGGVVLSVALPSLLWFPVSWAFFTIIKRSQLEGVGTTADRLPCTPSLHPNSAICSTFCAG